MVLGCKMKLDELDVSESGHWYTCRGKLLNVRDASTTQISGNTEIQNIKQIMGLQHGKVWSLFQPHFSITTNHQSI